MRITTNDMDANTPSIPASGKARQKWFPVVVIIALAAWWTRETIRTDYLTFLHVVAVLFTVLVLSAWYVVFGGARFRSRLAVVGIVWLVICGWFAVFKPVYNGAMGVYDWKFRYSTAADRLLSDATPAEQPEGMIEWQTTPHDYPRFLGSGDWPEVTGVELESDWAANPPEEVWRQEIGAGWSAFAIVGDYAVTQEQRGDRELVTCYRVDNGDVVWTHADPTRFDPNSFQGGLGGIGPRATPTIAGGRVLTQGGTGIVNCLDARTGEVIWSHDTAEEFASDVLVWGKSGSPLVVDDMVVVNVGAPSDEAAREDFDASLVAFDLETGQLRWTAGNRRASYASPMVTTLAGERQIVVVNEGYVTSHHVGDGQILWEYPWADEFDTNASASQPIPLAGDRLWLSKGYGTGASLLQVAKDEAGQWSVIPLWNPPIKRVMKTKFTNVVLRDGFVYGLDDVLLSCVDLETGEVQWKKRRQPAFGYGQILLVGDTVLVLTESGELVLVEATPDQYQELASIQALDPESPTWNTLAFSKPYLLVRNAREAACYRLPLKERESSK